MAKRELYRQAIALRIKGLTYGEIRTKVPVSKSTLSLWLRKYELTEEQLLKVKNKKNIQVERFRSTMRKKLDMRLNEYLLKEKKDLFPLTQKEFFVLGLGLYWGEGLKASRNTLSINNTDPSVVRVALIWYIKSLKIPLVKIRVQVHLYDDMDVEKELEYWSNYLNLSRDHFTRPYIKKSMRSEIDQKGYGHGTCGIRVSNTTLKEHVLMALKAISEEKEFTLV